MNKIVKICIAVFVVFNSFTFLDASEKNYEKEGFVKLNNKNSILNNYDFDSLNSYFACEQSIFESKVVLVINNEVFKGDLYGSLSYKSENNGEIYSYDGIVSNKIIQKRITLDLFKDINDYSYYKVVVYNDEKSNFDLLVYGNRNDYIDKTINEYISKVKDINIENNNYEMTSVDSTIVYQTALNTKIGNMTVGSLHIFHPNQMNSNLLLEMKVNSSTYSARTYLTNSLGNSVELIDCFPDQIVLTARSNNSDIVMPANGAEPLSNQTVNEIGIPYILPNGTVGICETSVLASSVSLKKSTYNGASAVNCASWTVYSLNSWMNGAIDGNSHSNKGYPFSMHFVFQGYNEYLTVKYLYYNLRMRYFYTYENQGVVEVLHISSQNASKTTTFTYIP